MDSGICFFLIILMILCLALVLAWMAVRTDEAARPVLHVDIHTQPHQNICINADKGAVRVCTTPLRPGGKCSFDPDAAP